MEIPSTVETKAPILFAAETKAMILVDDVDVNKKNGGNSETESQPLAAVSAMQYDKDDSSSSSTLILPWALVGTECSVSTVSIASSSDLGKSLQREEEKCSSSPPPSFPSYTSLRLNYLLVTLVIMLADGLQGTHLYVLYEGYGFNVASLYALGFVAGAVTTPITGPLIDRCGRKKSAILYCVLEMGINLLEQYPFLAGLLVSRMVGGITTNLLSSVFETWLDTEFRNRRRAAKNCIDIPKMMSDDASTASVSTSGWVKTDDEEDVIANNEYEVIMRDAVVVSNLASIASGYLAHLLAERYGPVGPFQGAVSCTGMALVAISFLWRENYGESISESFDGGEEEKVVGQDGDPPKDKEPRLEGLRQTHISSSKSVRDYIVEATLIFRSDPKVLFLGIIQGLSAGSLQLFVFLWSPTLQSFSPGGNMKTAETLPSLFRWAVDQSGEPAYGLIFGAFMAAGVTGGLCAPYIRQAVGILFVQREKSPLQQTVHISTEETKARPMELEFLLGMSYMFAAALMFVPSILQKASPESFSIALAAFFIYEFLVGVTVTCEGVARSLYLPSDGRATMMMVPRMIVNLAVSLGVLLTKCIATQSAFVAVAFLMSCSGALQLSFVSPQEWNMICQKPIRQIRRLSSFTTDFFLYVSKGEKNSKPKED